jgi:exosortase K
VSALVARGLGRAQSYLQPGNAIGLLTLVAAFGLKLAYRSAGARDLEWVLAPSCWLASRLGGVALVWEWGAGWISHQPRMVVGPACAGVNFLVVAWLAVFFSSQARWSGLHRKLAWCCASLLAAYTATLVTNGLRIVLAAHLYGADVYAGWLTPERLHRLLGVVLYCSVLVGLCRAAELRSRNGPPLPASWSSWSSWSWLRPFAWYAGIAIGIPLFNRAFVRDPAHFAEHALLTLGVGLVVVALWRGFGRLVDRLCSSSARS